MVVTTREIDGFGPLPVQRPDSVAELGRLIREAVTGSQAVYPVGGGTQLSLGRVPCRPGIAVDLRGLDQVIDFPARDMTVTVRAGLAVAKLRELVASENLQLPVDVPQPSAATIGGILATNVSGPRRYGYGTLRDYVIGISAVNDDGREFKAGGRVVKNVAGYDIGKLLIGSLGTLGIITQVTFKLRPLPETSAWVAIECEMSQLADVLDRLHRSPTRPVSVELCNRSAASHVFRHAGLAEPQAPWTVLVGYDGNSKAVAWQVEKLLGENLTNRCAAQTGDAAVRLLDALAEQVDLADAAVLHKICVRPSEVVQTARTLQSQHDTARSIRAHAGSGIVYVSCSAAEPPRVPDLPGAAAIVTLRCPRSWKTHLPIWGLPRDDVRLMCRVKKSFDPHNVFNPGRFLDGL